jgi:integrase
MPFMHAPAKSCLPRQLNCETMLLAPIGVVHSAEELSMNPLRRRLIKDMQIRNLTANTQRVYVEQVSRFAGHFPKSPDRLGPLDIRTYLLYLVQDRQMAAPSIIVTVSALRFFYSVTLKRDWVIEADIPARRQPKKLPVVLSREEVSRFLAAVENLKHRVILTVCYATGVRISEAVHLKPAAIDSQRLASSSRWPTAWASSCPTPPSSRRPERLWNKIGSSLHRFSQAECRNYLINAGYGQMG